MRKKRSFSEWLLYKMQKSREQKRTPEESFAELVNAGILNPDGSYNEHYKGLEAVFGVR